MFGFPQISHFFMNKVHASDVHVENDKKTNIKGVMTALRPTAYASEVGEALRRVTPLWFVNSMYGASILYVLVDTGVSTVSAYKNNEKQVISNRKHATIVCADQLVWHTFASMLLPAATIHTIVKYAGKLLRGTRYASVLPAAIGLASIPFIIHPLDDSVTWAMNNTVRPLYRGMVTIPSHG